MIVALVGMTLIMAVAMELAHSARSAGHALLATLAGIVGATVAWMLMSRFMVMDDSTSAVTALGVVRIGKAAASMSDYCAAADRR